MKIKKILLGLALSAIVSSQAHAQVNSQVGPRLVEFVQTYDTFIVVKLTTTFTNTQNCSSSKASDHVRFQSDDPAAKSWLASVLSARVAEIPVGFGVNGCRGGLPEVYRVDL